ncbi:hypothetical protein [Halomonas denitrificans]|nr:hypothetical protein [Halomonas denitrificans]
MRRLPSITLAALGDFLMVFGAGMATSAASIGEVVLARDPVSGAAYAIALLVFALAPAGVKRRASK